MSLHKVTSGKHKFTTDEMFQHLICSLLSKSVEDYNSITNYGKKFKKSAYKNMERYQDIILANNFRVFFNYDALSENTTFKKFISWQKQLAEKFRFHPVWGVSEYRYAGSGRIKDIVISPHISSLVIDDDYNSVLSMLQKLYDNGAWVKNGQREFFSDFDPKTREAVGTYSFTNQALLFMSLSNLLDKEASRRLFSESLQGRGLLNTLILNECECLNKDCKINCNAQQ